MFPSPTGVLYLLIEVVTACQIQNLVSVPYWGSLSSNKNLKSWHTLAEEFPSPTGVLYLLIIAKKLINRFYRLVSVPYWGSLSSNSRGSCRQFWRIQFPSPTGVLYLLIVIVERYFFLNMVSVPYWGSLSSNIIQHLLVRN